MPFKTLYLFVTVFRKARIMVSEEQKAEKWLAIRIAKKGQPFVRIWEQKTEAITNFNQKARFT